MIHFSTSSEHVIISRNEGFYMSARKADRIATKLWYALGFGAHELHKLSQIKVQLTNGQPSYDTYHKTDPLFMDRIEGFTPAELAVINDLIVWYASEEVHGWDKFPAFVYVNLNMGRSLVITERSVTK